MVAFLWDGAFWMPLYNYLDVIDAEVGQNYPDDC